MTEGHEQGGRRQKNIGWALNSDDDVMMSMTSLLLNYISQNIGWARAHPAHPPAPPLVQDLSATRGSKIGAERQVVIFTRHKLVEYVRNSAPDVMPLQKHKHSHLRKGEDNLQDCLPQKGILLKYIYMISGQSRGIPFSSGQRK